MSLAIIYQLVSLEEDKLYSKSIPYEYLTNSNKLKELDVKLQMKYSS